jgi:uncharacterized protein (TIGR02145 family)
MKNTKVSIQSVLLFLIINFCFFGCERDEIETTAEIEDLSSSDGNSDNQTTLKSLSLLNGIQVEIDILPGSDTNPVNVRGKGLITVAVLTTSIAEGESVDFDATEVDPTTLKFGPTEALIAHKKGHLEDVDGDGDIDLVVHFKTQDIGVQCGDLELEISGETFDGVPISGVNQIVTVGCEGPASEGIFDGSGNEYTFVTIGTQDWLIENLKTTKYNDGTDIPHVTDDLEWINLSTPGYCWYYNDKATYGDTYGALYNGYTVDTEKLCPIGWHVPSDEEWTALINYLGGSSIAGGKLKETGTEHWVSPNTGATNETGFTALPGGCRVATPDFKYVGYHGEWWSSTEYSPDNAWNRGMGYSGSYVGRSGYHKIFGFSVRCVRDK